MGINVVIYVKFFLDVACQKILKLANVSQSYSKPDPAHCHRFSGDSVEC